jgi:hypothetical protein
VSSVNSVFLKTLLLVGVDQTERGTGTARWWLVRYIVLLRHPFQVDKNLCGLSPPRTGFAPGSIHVGFVVDKVALGQGFLPVLRLFLASTIPPLLHIHLSPPHEVCDISTKKQIITTSVLS